VQQAISVKTSGIKALDIIKMYNLQLEYQRSCQKFSIKKKTGNNTFVNIFCAFKKNTIFSEKLRCKNFLCKIKNCWAGDFCNLVYHLSVKARKNCTTTIVMATEIDYVTLLLCVHMFKCKSEEIMSFGWFLGIVLVEARSPQLIKII
jgi:hypothetical protein